MKKVRVMLIVLALGVGIVDGCSESDRPAEKAAAPATQAVESAAKMPAEVGEAASTKATEAVDKAVDEVAAVASQAAESAAKMQAEVKDTVTAKAADAVEKAAEGTAAASSTAKEAVKETVATAKDIERGAAIFIQKCTACHGVGGKGSAMAPAFVGNDWIKAADKAEIAGVIKNGRQGPEKKYRNFVIGMPAFKQMPESDVNALVDYIKSIE